MDSPARANAYGNTGMETEVRQLKVRRERDATRRDATRHDDDDRDEDVEIKIEIKSRALTPKHRRLASAQDHQQTREELLNRVHALKTELQDWRYKMDNQVKNYKGELASLKETLSSEVQALRKELEETSDRLKRSIVSTSSVSTGHSPGLHRLPPP
jgi:hypothetical protein